MIVSGHQPTLFGTAGYWSKIANANVHLVTTAVPFRKADHLTRLMLMDGSATAIPTSSGALIKDVKLRAVRKMLPRVRQAYGAKRMPYRDRLDPILKALDRDDCYLVDLWQALFDATCQAASLRPNFKIVDTPSVGETTHQRLMNRIDAEAPLCGWYMVGPGGRGYIEQEDRRGRVIVVHEMNNPSPFPFIHDIVTKKDVWSVLLDYTATPI